MQDTRPGYVARQAAKTQKTKVVRKPRLPALTVVYDRCSWREGCGEITTRLVDVAPAYKCIICNSPKSWNISLTVKEKHNGYES